MTILSSFKIKICLIWNYIKHGIIIFIMKAFQKKKIILLLSLMPVSLGATELTASFNLGNLGFDRNATSAQQALQWGTAGGVLYQIDERISLSAEILRDDLTGYRMNGTFSYTTPYGGISIGPSFSSFNNGQGEVKPGINGTLSVGVQGVFCFEASMYTSLGEISQREYDYDQKDIFIKSGFNIPGAITTLSLERKQYRRYEGDLSSWTADRTSRYALMTDLYKKNIPFHLLLDLGYKSTERESSSGYAGIGSVFIGVGTLFNIGSRMELTLTMDSGLYSFSLSDSISPEEISPFLFEIASSITYRF